MDENFEASDVVDADEAVGAENMHMDYEQNNNVDINTFAMDEKGNIRSTRNGAIAIQSNPRILIVLGWVSAAFTAFISPYFAIPGIILGVFVNRQARGKGAAIIITNVVLAAVNLIFSMFIINALRNMMYGY